MVKRLVFKDGILMELLPNGKLGVARYEVKGRSKGYQQPEGSTGPLICGECHRIVKETGARKDYVCEWCLEGRIKWNNGVTGMAESERLKTMRIEKAATGYFERRKEFWLRWKRMGFARRRRRRASQREADILKGWESV